MNDKGWLAFEARFRSESAWSGEQDRSEFEWSKKINDEVCWTAVLALNMSLLDAIDNYLAYLHRCSAHEQHVRSESTRLAARICLTISLALQHSRFFGQSTVVHTESHWHSQGSLAIVIDAEIQTLSTRFYSFLLDSIKRLSWLCKISSMKKVFSSGRRRTLDGHMSLAHNRREVLLWRCS